MIAMTAADRVQATAISAVAENVGNGSVTSLVSFGSSVNAIASPGQRSIRCLGLSVSTAICTARPFITRAIVSISTCFTQTPGCMSSV
jgi:hypothetical protein